MIRPVEHRVLRSTHSCWAMLWLDTVEVGGWVLGCAWPCCHTESDLATLQYHLLRSCWFGRQAWVRLLHEPTLSWSDHSRHEPRLQGLPLGKRHLWSMITALFIRDRVVASEDIRHTSIRLHLIHEQLHLFFSKLSLFAHRALLLLDHRFSIEMWFLCRLVIAVTIGRYKRLESRFKRLSVADFTLRCTCQAAGWCIGGWVGQELLLLRCLLSGRQDFERLTDGRHRWNWTHLGFSAAILLLLLLVETEELQSGWAHGTSNCWRDRTKWITALEKGPQ